MQPLNPKETMRRTMANLRIIERELGDRKARGVRVAEEGPFEITQLVNSFLGALAHPWERTRGALNELPIAEARDSGWPVVGSDRGEQEPETLGDFLRLVRNGFAHGNVQFIPDEHGGIETVRFWNTHPRSGKRTWGSALGVSDLRQFLECFAALAEGIPDDRWLAAREL
jgi:hypothetical protein